MLGRRREREVLDRLVASLLAGQSRALAVRGEAGIGKTAMLDHVGRGAEVAGCQVVRSTAVESEMELAYAGAQQLCAPFLDRLDELPEPQADALAVAFGRKEGTPPDRFIVGLALLGLASVVASGRPLVWVVDDAQWLDRASAEVLAFVARRLVAESVGLVFAVRDGVGHRFLTGVEELRLAGLEPAIAGELLDAVVPGSLDAAVRDRIVAESGGNPLALLELNRGRRSDQVADGHPVPSERSVSRRVEQSFARQIADLPADTRLLLLLAACEPAGDPVRIFKAAERLGVGPEAAAPATQEGLVNLAGHVLFRHPLVRSAAWHAASAQERRAADRALAEVTDRESDPDRRAWHLARATAGLDETVAAELEASADRARGRGGIAAGAAFRARAVELTPDPAVRSRRALAAAEETYPVGSAQEALRLVAIAEAGPLGDHERARADLVRAHVSYATARGRDATALYVRAAHGLAPHDPTTARETFLWAFLAALSAGRLARGADVRDVAAAVLAAEEVGSLGEPERASDLILHGLAVLTTDGYAAGAPALRSALDALDEETVEDDDALRWLWVGCLVARIVADDAALARFSERQVRLARRSGRVALLPVAMAEQVSYALLVGDVATASAIATDAATVVEVIGSPASLDRSGWLAAYRGDLAATDALRASRSAGVLDRGEGQWFVATGWMSALVRNALGRYDEAFEATEEIAEHPYDLGLALWCVAERAEAAVRSARHDRAREAVDRLVEIADGCGTAWARGVAARCRAMLCEGAEAETLYEESLELLGQTSVRTALARTHLVYGEWLRRENRRVDARHQLRLAHTMFTEMGADAFAERARRELAATGETARRRTPDTLDDLTAQEHQIARLAAAGSTNTEIGAQLFLSPRTVEWHLHKVFAKLGLSSRRQLRSALERAGGGG
ncbi:UNVERIFIED_CONTAM: hypothetical protein LK11_18205 [Mumia flava]